MWRKFSAAILGVFIMVSVVYGAPASPDLLDIEQPDGSIFKGKIHGDEFQNWIEAPETGHTVFKNKQNGYWEYAEKKPDGTLAPSGMKVDPSGLGAPAFLPRGLKPERDVEKAQKHNSLLQETFQQRLAPSASSSDGYSALSADGIPQGAIGDWTSVPVSGSKKVLIVLVNFANRSLVTTASGWSSTIFDTTPGALSVANFYNDNSFGAMTISPATHTQPGNPQGIVTVSIANTHPNSGSSYNYTSESSILNAALAQAVTYVDFASFDTNANGTLEQSELSIYFIYAGWEASGSGKTPNIWAHAWGGAGVTVGGKAVTKWALNGELNNSDVQHPMGVIAHELGHALCGLPDLYDTSSVNAGLGAFSLMSSGSWGGDIGQAGGTTPSALDAWSREYLGWTTPVVPSSAGSYNLGTSLSSNTATLKLINGAQSTSEYFLAENRYPTGWDKGLKRFLGAGWGGGLLITHIDITSGTQGANDINRYVAGGHQGVMAEQANTTGCNMATTSCAGSPSTLYYSGNNASFADTSAPNSRYYSGVQSGINLTSISAPGATMSLTYGVTPTPATGINLTPSVASPQTAGASVTFTAAGSGGTGSYEYRFWLRTPGGSWLLKQDFSPTDTWTWNTSGQPAGTYVVEASVRAAGTSPTAGYDAYTQASYTINAAPTATGVTVTSDKASPQVAGTSVVFTASGAGGSGSYEYRYYLLPPGGSWTLKQAYSSTATWTFNTTGMAPGTYQVEVAVRSAGSSANYEAYKTSSFVISSNAATGVTVTSDKASPQVAGTSVVFTSSGAGGSGSYEYRYYLLPPGGSWTLKQAYSSTATWTFNTTGMAPGTYQVEVAVRSAGSSANYEAYKTSSFVISSNAATGVTVTSDKASPQVAGTSVVFTASGAGGSGSYEYRYYLLPPGGSWTLKQAYSSTATWTFNTTGMAPGTYQVEVAVRSAGSSANYEAYKTSSFVVSSNAATGVTVTSDKANPQVAGTSVVFTASGAGGSGSYEYRYWLRNLNGSWTMVQNYSSTATWSWNTAGLAAGTYMIEVDAKTTGSSPAGGYDTYKMLTFTIN